MTQIFLCAFNLFFITYFTCLTWELSKWANICKTSFAIGRHFSFPDLWRQRFINNAVEYSSPYHDAWLSFSSPLSLVIWALSLLETWFDQFGFNCSKYLISHSTIPRSISFFLITHLHVDVEIKEFYIFGFEKRWVIRNAKIIKKHLQIILLQTKFL